LLLKLAPSPTVDDIYRRLSSVLAERMQTRQPQTTLSILQGSLPPCTFMESEFRRPKGSGPIATQYDNHKWGECTNGPLPATLPMAHQPRPFSWHQQGVVRAVLLTSGCACRAP